MSLYPCRNQWPAENVCHYCRYTKYGSMNCYYSLIQTKQISKFYRNRVIMHYNNGSSKMAPELELKCKFPYNMEACVQQQWKINIYHTIFHWQPFYLPMWRVPILMDNNIYRSSPRKNGIKTWCNSLLS